jgi:hypothetical protein
MLLLHKQCHVHPPLTLVLCSSLDFFLLFVRSTPQPGAHFFGALKSQGENRFTTLRAKAFQFFCRNDAV